MDFNASRRASEVERNRRILCSRVFCVDPKYVVEGGGGLVLLSIPMVHCQIEKCQQHHRSACDRDMCSGAGVLLCVLPPKTLCS